MLFAIEKTIEQRAKAWAALFFEALIKFIIRWCRKPDTESSAAT